MAKIIIRRKKSFAGSAQNHDVYFMNTYVGVLKNGGELEVPVEVGMHTIYFQSQLKKFGSKASFTAFVNLAVTLLFVISSSPVAATTASVISSIV